MTEACKCYEETREGREDHSQLTRCMEKYLSEHLIKKEDAKDETNLGIDSSTNERNGPANGTKSNQESRAFIEPDLSSLPVIPSSISRKYLNETSYRYLSMVFTEDEFIPGKPARTIPGRAAYYVPGKPGKLKCKSTGGYQCIDFNRTVCFNNPVQTKCKTVGGSPGYWVPAKAPQYIPAVPARTVTHRRQLTIDCDDQTYDIKNDGIGWKSYWQNSTVSRLAQETCPAISSYPLR